jgi:hypothetical protein
VLPYVQDLPMRFRSMLLEAKSNSDDGLWSKLER